MKYTLPFDVRRSTWGSCPVRIQLRRSGSATLEPIDTSSPITLTDTGGHGLDHGILVAGPQTVSPDKKTIDLVLSPGPEVNDVTRRLPPSLSLLASAHPATSAMSSAKATSSAKAPTATAAFEVVFGTPPDRIHLNPDADEIILDSLTGARQFLRAAVQHWDMDARAYQGDFESPPTLRFAFEEGEDVVDGQKPDLHEGVLVLRLRTTRLVLGDGKPRQFATLRFEPTAGTPGFERFHTSGGSPRAVALKVQTSPVTARIEVYRKTGRLRAVLASHSQTLTTERVQVVVRAPTEAAVHDLRVDVEVTSSPANYEASHRRVISGVAIDDSSHQTEPIDLRTIVDNVSSDTVVTVSIPDDAHGLWLLSGTKVGFGTIEPIALGEHGLTAEQQRDLRAHGGTIEVPLTGTLISPVAGEPMVSPLLDATTTLLVVEGEPDVPGVYDPTSGHAVFTYVPAQQATMPAGPPLRVTLPAVAVPVDAAVAASMNATATAAVTIDPQLAPTAQAWQQAVLAHLSTTNARTLADAWTGFMHRLASTEAVARQTVTLGAGVELALGLRSQVIDRQIENLTNALIELATLGLSQGSWWRPTKEATEQALEEAAEGGIKSVLKRGETELAPMVNDLFVEAKQWRSAVDDATSRRGVLAFRKRTMCEEIIEADLERNVSRLERAIAEENALFHKVVDVDLPKSFEADWRHQTLKKHLDAFVEAGAAAGPDFERRLKDLFATLGNQGEVLEAQVERLRRDIIVTVGDTAHQGKEAIEALRQQIPERRRQLQAHLAMLEARPKADDVLGTIETHRRQLANLDVIDDALVKQSAFIDTTVRAAIERQGQRAMALEVPELAFTKVLADQAVAARDLKAAATKRPLPTYADYDPSQSSWMAWAWWNLDRMTTAVGGIVDDVLSWQPLASLGGALSTYGGALVASFSRLLTWVIKATETLSPTVSALDTDLAAAGRTLPIARDTIDEFRRLLDRDREVVSALWRELHPQQLVGTVDLHEAHAVATDKARSPRAAEADITREQVALTKRFGATVMTELLQTHRVDRPLSKAAADLVERTVRQTPRILEGARSYQRALALGGKAYIDQLAALYRVTDDGLDWAEVDQAIDWTAFVAGWFLRIAAALNIATLVGAAWGVVIMTAAELTDAVGAGLRVAVGSIGTLRCVNGIAEDLLMLHGAAAHALFEDEP